MKERSKIVLEGAITELLKNEYDRYLAADELLVQIDSQVYLGSVTKDEGELCKKAFDIIQKNRDEIMTVFENLLNDIFNLERPAKEVQDKEVPEIEGQMEIEEVKGE